MRTGRARRLTGLVGTSPVCVLAIFVGSARAQVAPEVSAESLSPYMNAAPPGKDFFCVGNGPANRALHPDRASDVRLAQQDGVILFSGAAPQHGLNFTLTAGSLVYRNQMSTLGVSEPPPQVGAAGLLKERPWENPLPWTEARWHPGEDITWHGIRVHPSWIGGLPYWAFSGSPGGQMTSTKTCTNDDVMPPPYQPIVTDLGEANPSWGLSTSINLALSRGIYQMSEVLPGWSGTLDGACPYEFREPWFQGRGREPAYNLTLDLDGNAETDGDPIRLAADYFPNYLNIYGFRQLELDGGRLTIDFERSATWPRRPTVVEGPARSNGELTGASLASKVADEYGNEVVFDRVPKYGWETDYKVPHRPGGFTATDPNFRSLPDMYRPRPEAWRLPHKRLRTVRLVPKGAAAAWTIAFVFEHPESDRISDLEAPQDWEEWKSIYSDQFQADWEFGRLPDLNDETTLLTVQAYRGNATIDGAPFNDDRSVWESELGVGDATTRGRLNELKPGVVRKPDPQHSSDGDACPGMCEFDDDGDNLTDEDTNDQEPFLNITSDCAECQQRVAGESPVADSPCWRCPLNAPDCEASTRIPNSTHVDTGCKNPLYWNLAFDALGNTRFDPFASWDDDEDGIIDEDGPEDPLLVDLRAIPANDPKDCASGRHPFVPATQNPPAELDDATRALLPGPAVPDAQCRPVLESSSTLDPWIYQVQYVYARSNPYWLLTERDANGAVTKLAEPKYYYYPPFDEPGTGPNGCGDYNGDNSVGHFPAPGARPNVHPDCVPDPGFQGQLGHRPTGDLGTRRPSDIHLIKRIVRTRPDSRSPKEFIEEVWLYRYNDIGFLKAVFDPAAVEALIHADETDGIKEPDDILRYADTHKVLDRPLIYFASQWYDYYNPLPWRQTEQLDWVGAPPCYEVPPHETTCDTTNPFSVDPDDPAQHLPVNRCDGGYLWEEGYTTERHADPDCSEFLRQDCGWCLSRRACGKIGQIDTGASCPDYHCECPYGYARNDSLMEQLGIAGAQPRFRKYMVKTARVRGADGEMHLYRFDYLGAASSVYADEGRIQSYADAHNIAIVDELVEQTAKERGGAFLDRNEFYIYEDDFKLGLDPSEPDPEDPSRPVARDAGYENGAMRATTHYLHIPVKVKTRRVVTRVFQFSSAASD